MPLKCIYCFIVVIKHASLCQLNYLTKHIYTYTHTHTHTYTYTHTHTHTHTHTIQIINSTKIETICQKNLRFGTNTLHNLQGHSLHIHRFTPLLKRFIVSS